MGSSASVDQFVRKIDQAAKALNDPKPGLTAVGLAGKATFIAAAGSSIGVRPVGKRKPVGARYDLDAKRRDVVVTYTGPAHLLNNPTRQHFITARRQASRRRAGQLASGVGAVRAFGGSARGMFGTLGRQSVTRGGSLRGGARSLTIGSNHRAYAFHPGTKGKGFAAGAKRTVARQSPQIYMRVGVTNPLRGVFR